MVRRPTCRDVRRCGIGFADNLGRCAAPCFLGRCPLDRARHGAGALLLHLDKTSPCAGAWEKSAPAPGLFCPRTFSNASNRLRWPPFFVHGSDAGSRKPLATLPVALLLVVGQRLGGVLGLGLGNCNGTKQLVYDGKHLFDGLVRKDNGQDGRLGGFLGVR